MNKISESEIQYWIELIRGGDSAAYEKLLAYLCTYLERIVLNKIGDEHVTRDIVQETVLGVHKSLATYERGRPFYPWLYSLMKYKIADYWRQYEKHQANELFDEMTPDNSQIVDSIHIQEVLDAISELSLRDQRIFTRTKVLGHSVSEVAKEENLSQSNIKVIVHRSIKIIREFFYE